MRILILSARNCQSEPTRSQRRGTFPSTAASNPVSIIENLQCALNEFQEMMQQLNRTAK